MEVIVHILLVSIFINTLLKLSFWKLPYQILFGVLLGGFVLYTYPIAIEQSKTQMAQWLQDSAILSNMAVLVTIEAIVYISFCFLSFKYLHTNQTNRKYLMLKMYSGVLVFPVALYVVIQSVFYFTGTDFFQIALSIAGGLVIVTPVVSSLMRRLLPEEETRLEMLFLTSLLVTTLGLIATTNGNMMYVPKSQPIDYVSLSGTFVLFILLFVFGYLINRLKWKRFSNKQKSKKALD